jgi:hypothetical protein
MNLTDWQFAEKSLIELASYTVVYGLDDKDELLFNHYVSECELRGLSASAEILKALGRKKPDEPELSEVFYEYKICSFRMIMVLKLRLEYSKDIDLKTSLANYVIKKTEHLSGFVIMDSVITNSLEIKKSPGIKCFFDKTTFCDVVAELILEKDGDLVCETEEDLLLKINELESSIINAMGKDIDRSSILTDDSDIILIPLA